MIEFSKNLRTLMGEARINAVNLAINLNSTGYPVHYGSVRAWVADDRAPANFTEAIPAIVNVLAPLAKKSYSEAHAQLLRCDYGQDEKQINGNYSLGGK